MTPNIGDQMMLAEWLFIRTLEDLRTRCENPADQTRYALLGIAPLLRKLFIDEAPLIDTLKPGKRGVKLTFRIRPFVPATDADLRRRMQLAFGNADLVGTSSDVPVGKEAFLNTVAGIAGNEAFTVRDVVGYFANVEGGVHFGPPKEKYRNTLSDVLRAVTPSMFSLGNQWVESLAHLGAIALGGLAELEASIRASATDNATVKLTGEAGPIRTHWIDTP